MGRIIIGREDGLEAFARGFAQFPEELRVFIARRPARQNRDAAAIGQNKAAHINGIGIGMFGHVGGGNAADLPTGIAAHGFNADHGHAIKIPRRVLQWTAHPGGKAAREGALGGAQICDAGPRAGQQNSVDCRTPILPPIIWQDFIFGAQPIEIRCALPDEGAAGHGRLVAGRLMSIKGAGNTSGKQQGQQQEGGHKKGAMTTHDPFIERFFSEKPVSV